MEQFEIVLSLTSTIMPIAVTEPAYNCIRVQIYVSVVLDFSCTRKLNVRQTYFWLVY